LRPQTSRAGLLLTKVDVLAALGQAHEEDLLPTPDAFVGVGDVAQRAQLTSFLGSLGSTGRWFVQAEGGIGKTVFVQSVARQLDATDEVVLFDCFGGGAYRSPIDERHRPERGLMHIVNELACRGLCDPILPGSTEPNEVIRRAIERFSQALVSLRRTRPNARLVIIMDAADNAADEARNRNQPSFPKALLESLTLQPSIDGLILIATARSERQELAIGTAQCMPFKIKPFNPNETSNFILSRRPEATPAQIAALHSRSDGNPRVLANLIEVDRLLSGETQTEEKVRLDSLISWEIPRLCRGGSRSLTFPAVCALAALCHGKIDRWKRAH
jgi:NACHT domain